MTGELNALIITAASIAFFHTLFGPDHYLPFIMMSWSRKWSTTKTAMITILCGIGHVGSSVILGLIGVAMGLAVKKLEIVESVRGDFAAWLLTAFGLAYLVWGLRQAYRNKPHVHSHLHTDTCEHTHVHGHHEEHLHVHDGRKNLPSIAPWTLFVIFVFGPCEPLIPILMYPAAQSSLFGLVVVTGVFSVITIGTMLVTVLLSRAGVDFLPLTQIQRFTHALAGGAIFLCGLAIVFLGL
ncbi:MAG: sulfite exporter TauE/SafE family protein [Planctomycetota bacterium]|nr:sulfite exporter TauE/SafE family protein [Planctomycetota bacterium]